ncbi:inositol polyphosphate 1-phosphatase [Bacillus rossius redtenbacheri]|uniref:inositol polyphosphate 1-phosphatase n=1 Tax=Bacillus rossius redtenbacheri TaxID=93214 RepID=UPI002FDE126F
MNSHFLEALLKVSEKAANIARACRQNQHLFKLLVQEKKSDEKNPRFVQDFKTLADVLIQETVKHDIGRKFAEIADHIRGEESNLFCNTLGETITVQVEKDQASTAALLSKVLEGDAEAAELLAMEVHREMLLEDINVGSTSFPHEVEVPLHQMAMWIDPIDSTAEYISGEEVKSPAGDVYQSGLPCVTVLLGVYDRHTGAPVLGVVNQPFFSRDGTVWHGRCLWGVSYNGVSRSSVKLVDASKTKKVVVLSSSESTALRTALRWTGYHPAEVAGAGYKLLCVADGSADAYILSKATTFYWDTCGPHALLRALGGCVKDYDSLLQTADIDRCKELSYKVSEVEDAAQGISKFCNHGGFIATRDRDTLEELAVLICRL